MIMLHKKQRRRIVRDAKRALVIALPLMGAQVLQVSNGLVDVYVAGQLGKEELAAGGMGGGIWFFVSMACIGLMAGLSPTLAKLIGASRRVAVGAQFRQGLWFAAAVGLLALVLIRICMATVADWGIAPELPPLIREYLSSAGWSLPAFAFLMACRNFYEATGVTKPVLIVQFVGLVVNFFLNFAFGLGYWGFPRLGLFGIGIATSAVAIVMACLLFVWLRSPRFQRYALFQQFDWPNVRVIGNMFLLAIPIYLAMVFEGGLFFFTNIQMAVLGTVESAAHNIAITVTALCFMLPLGLSLALTGRIGRAHGRGSLALAQLRITSGALLTIALATFTIVSLLLTREWVAALYTDDAAVQALAATLFLFAAVFQFSDGAQVVLFGLLRGLQDMRVPMLINAFAYWAVAAPIGYYITHYTKVGAVGLWLGLIIGLTVGSALLAWRLKHQLYRAF